LVIRSHFGSELKNLLGRKNSYNSDFNLLSHDLLMIFPQLFFPLYLFLMELIFCSFVIIFIGRNCKLSFFYVKAVVDTVMLIEHQFVIDEVWAIMNV